MKESKKILLMVAAFFACFYLPVKLLPFRNPVFEALALVRWYTGEHVLLCLVPAFFIAGAVSVFVRQASVIKYFAKEIETGNFVYEVINIEEKGNEHFVQDYKLHTKSVVLSLVKDGQEIKFKNLEQVWQFLRNKNKFYQYIKNETQVFLDGLKEDDQS
ncbi:MAG: permease [Candidatus Omnitrophica bacterium]|nr:permease [Candidatus Omnitrophota bacterium]